MKNPYRIPHNYNPNAVPVEPTFFKHSRKTQAYNRRLFYGQRMSVKNIERYAQGDDYADEVPLKLSER